MCAGVLDINFTSPLIGRPARTRDLDLDLAMNFAGLRQRVPRVPTVPVGLDGATLPEGRKKMGEHFRF